MCLRIWVCVCSCPCRYMYVCACAAQRETLAIVPQELFTLFCETGSLCRLGWLVVSPRDLFVSTSNYKPPNSRVLRSPGPEFAQQAL